MSEAFLDKKKPKNKSIVIRGVENMVFWPIHEEWDGISLELSPAFDKIWNGSETAEEALKRVVPKINKKYFENK